MQIDRRITNGLAWAGALLVVGIPAADLLSAQFMGGNPTAQVAVIEPVAPVPAPASQRPDEPVKVAEAAPVKPAPAPTVAANPADPLNSYLQSGKKLPSYITGGTDETAPAAPVAAAPTPAPVVPAPATATAEPARPAIVTPAAPAAVATDPVQVASLPDKIAPIPMPLSMRPKPVAAYAPVAPSQQVVVRPAPPVAVTTDDLQDWESGPLSEFLARRQQQAGASQDYRPGGFYLDEETGQQGPDRYVGPIDPPIFLPFTN